MRANNDCVYYLLGFRGGDGASMLSLLSVMDSGLEGGEPVSSWSSTGGAIISAGYLSLALANLFLISYASTKSPSVFSDDVRAEMKLEKNVLRWMPHAS